MYTPKGTIAFSLLGQILNTDFSLLNNYFEMTSLSSDIAHPISTLLPKSKVITVEKIRGVSEAVFRMIRRFPIDIIQPFTPFPGNILVASDDINQLNPILGLLAYSER